MTNVFVHCQKTVKIQTKMFANTMEVEQDEVLKTVNSLLEDSYIKKWYKLSC